MVKIPRDILLVLAMTGGVIAQVTSTATPNAAEYEQIKSDIISYHSALTTQSLYLAAESYIKDHSTSIPPIGLQLYTKSWSEGISSLNALITTSFPTAFPTVVASLYVSALSEQANIINKDVTHADTTGTTAPLATDTGSISPTANNTSSDNTSGASIISPSATMSASPSASSGAANARMIVNGMMVAAGLGVAILL